MNTKEMQKFKIVSVFAVKLCPDYTKSFLYVHL